MYTITHTYVFYTPFIQQSRFVSLISVPYRVMKLKMITCNFNVGYQFFKIKNPLRRDTSIAKSLISIYSRIEC